MNPVRGSQYHRKTKAFLGIFLSLVIFGDFSGPIWPGETQISAPKATIAINPSSAQGSRAGQRAVLYRKKLEIFIARKNRRITKNERDQLIHHIIEEAPKLRFPARFRMAGKPIDKVALLVAFVKVESTFKRRAVSRSNAQGYMQLKPTTVAWLDKKMGYRPGHRRLFRTSINIRKGVQYINHLAEIMPNLRYTVLAYNAGPGSVQRGRWHIKYWRDVRRNYLEFLAIRIPKKPIQVAVNR